MFFSANIVITLVFRYLRDLNLKLLLELKMTRIILLLLLGYCANGQILSTNKIFEQWESKIKNGQDLRIPNQDLLQLPNAYPDSFLLILDKIKPIIEEHPNLKYWAWHKIAMAGAMEKKAKYNEALEYGLDALRDLKNSNEKLLLADAHNNVGLVHMRLKIKPEQAIEHLQKALKIYTEYNDQMYMALVHLNMGNIYLHLLKDQEASAKENEICRAITEKLPPSNTKTILNIGIGSGYMFTGEFAKAIQYLQQGLAQSDSLSPMIKATTYQNLGVTQSLVGNYKNAKENLLIAIDLLDELDHTPHIRSALFALGKAAKRTNNFEDASIYLQLAFEWSDSLLVENQEKLALEAAEKYESEIKEQQNQLLKSRQNLLVAGVSGLALLLGIVFYAFYKNRQKNLILASQKLQLQQQEKQKQEFFENITHEFRTPLTIIRGLAQSIEENSIEPDINHVKARQIDQNANRISLMVDDVLRLASEGKGEFNLLRTRVNLKGFFRKMQSMYELLLAEKKQKIICTIPDNELTLMLDERKMDIIWSNLIANASKYSPEGAKIFIDIRRQNEEVILSIQNEGSLIPSDQFEAIFQRYNREIKHENISGNGIGLAAVKDLVEIQEGKISVNSSEKEGTTFCVSFPIHLKADMGFTAEEFAQAKSQTNANSETRILLVDDNPDLLLFMEELLQKEGYSVYLSRSGTEALKMLNVVRPDLLITDLVMPEMDGRELLIKARENSLFEFLPIIFLTASANEETRLELLELGIDDFLRKPFDKRELLARLRFIVQRNQQAKQERDNTLAEIDKSKPSELVNSFKLFLNENMNKLHINIPDVAEALNMTERSLYRHIKTQTGLTPNELIKELRLQRARILLELRKYATIKEVSYEVGFESSSHFAQIYEQRFGKHPSEYFN